MSTFGFPLVTTLSRAWRGAAIAVLSALLLGASSARAEPSPAGMGERGRLTLSVDRIFGLRRDTESSGSFSSTTLGLATAGFPARVGLDYTLVSRVTIGGALGFSSDAYRLGSFENERKTLLVAPRLGYVFPLGTSLGVWPRVGASYDRTWVASNQYSSSSFTEIALNADAPLVIAPSDHFALTVGPTIDWAVHGWSNQGPSNSQRRLLGVAFGVLGSF